MYKIFSCLICINTKTESFIYQVLGYQALQKTYFTVSSGLLVKIYIARIQFQDLTQLVYRPEGDQVNAGQFTKNYLKECEKFV